MNKQQLASKIWASANKMRSKIEANEYKDYILGFIFYRYLSEKELRFFTEQGMTDEDIRQMDERIRQLKAKEKQAQQDKPESRFAYAAKVGFRIGAELISGVIIGAGIGYLLDNWFGTRPLLLIIFLFLGSIAGFLNVYRFVKSTEKEQE